MVSVTSNLTPTFGLNSSQNVRDKKLFVRPNRHQPAQLVGTVIEAKKASNLENGKTAVSYAIRNPKGDYDTHTVEFTPHGTNRQYFVKNA